MREGDSIGVVRVALLCMSVVVGLFFPHVARSQEPIAINDSADVEAKRDVLIGAIFGTSTLPGKSTPDSIVTGDNLGLYSLLADDRGNLDRIDGLYVRMDNGYQARMDLYVPRKSNGKLFLVHGGHIGGATHEDVMVNNDGLQPGLIIPALLAEGYHVLGCSMPLLGDNKFENDPYRDHKEIFASLDKPESYFFEPLVVGLNYLTAKYGFNDIRMVGLSGGGWTTTVLAAMDPRINRSYEVAGSMPRPISAQWGDVEYVFPDSVANYSELYVMASFGAGRSHTQILNRYDDCCFNATVPLVWMPMVSDVVSSLGSGRYNFYLDETHNSHKISRYALAIIQDSSDENVPSVPVPIGPLYGTSVLGSATFDWRQSLHASSYRFQLATDTGFTNIVFENNAVTDPLTEVYAGPVEADKNYFWRVRAENGSHVSGYSLPALVRSDYRNHSPILTGFDYAGSKVLVAREDSAFSAKLVADDSDGPLFGACLKYSISPDSLWIRVDSLSGVITGLPAAHHVGSHPFVVSVTDDSGATVSAQMSIEVKHTNHPPVIRDEPDTTGVEDVPFLRQLLATDQDLSLFHDLIRFRFEHAPAWMAIDSITGRIQGIPEGIGILDSHVSVIAFDDSCSADTLRFAIHVRHVNHAPSILGVITKAQFVKDASSSVVSEEDVPFNGVLRAVDLDSLTFGDRLTYRLTLHPQWLSIDSTTGELRGTPRASDVGNPSMEVVVEDGQGGMLARPFNISVVHTNRKPVFTALPHLVFSEDSSAWLNLRSLATDPDGNGQPLQWGVRVVDSATASVLHVALDTVSATVQFTSAANYFGPHLRVILTATDALGASTNDTLLVTILPVNDRPVFAYPDTLRVRESDSLTVPYSAFFTSVEDPDNADSTLVWNVAGGTHVSVLRTATGFRFKGERYWNGTELFMLSAIDSCGLADTTQLVVIVTAVDDPPVLAGVPDISFPQDSCYVLWLAPYLTDPDDSVAALQWMAILPDYHKTVDLSSGSASSVPGEGDGTRTVTDSLHLSYDIASGTITFKAAPHFTCSNMRVVIHAIDADSTACDTILVSVTRVNHSPRITNQPDTVASNGSRYAFRLSAMDPDDTLLVFSLKGPAWLRVDSTGTVQGVPTEVGVFSVALYVTDPHGACDSLHYTLTVTVGKTGVDEEEGIPQDFVLRQNYPNPFNPSTTIRFGLPERSSVHIEAYNMAGQRVQEIVMTDLDAGYHSITWHPTSLASGAYILVLQGKGLVSTGRDVRMVKKAVLLR
jgi:hypothetical protein